MALQLCHSHCRGLRSWCGVCPLAHWQPTCQPLASEMLPWTGCDIGGAERSLKSFKLHILPRCFDMIDCGKKDGNLYHMYNCDHRVSSTTSSKTGPSWPPSRSGLTQRGGSSSHSVLAMPPYPHLPTSTGSTRSVSNYFGFFL